MPLENDDDEERLVRIEQMTESLKAQTAELGRLAKRAAVRTGEAQKRSRTLRAQTQTTRHATGVALSDLPAPGGLHSHIVKRRNGDEG